jgi:hypothetical protein
LYTLTTLWKIMHCWVFTALFSVFMLLKVTCSSSLWNSSRLHDTSDYMWMFQSVLSYGSWFFFHIRTVRCDIIKVFYSPTNVQVIVLKTILTFTFTFTWHTVNHCRPTNICSHVTTELITHQCTIIVYFNDCNFSNNE